MIKCFPDILIKPQATIRLVEQQRQITGRTYRIQCKKGAVVVKTSPDDTHNEGFLIVLDDYLNLSGDVWVTNLSYGTAVISISEVGDSTAPEQVEDITINPYFVESMSVNTTQQFTCDNTGKDLIWVVTKGKGTISQTGLYTAPDKGWSSPTVIEARNGNHWGKTTIGQITSDISIIGLHNTNPYYSGSTVPFNTIFSMVNSVYSDYEFIVFPEGAGTLSSSGLFISPLFSDTSVNVQATHKEDPTINAVGVITNINPTLDSLRMEIRQGDPSTYDEEANTWNMIPGEYYAVTVYPEPAGVILESITLSTDEATIVASQPSPSMFLIHTNTAFTNKTLTFTGVSRGVTVNFSMTINAINMPTITGTTHRAYIVRSNV